MSRPGCRSAAAAGPAPLHTTMVRKLYRFSAGEPWKQHPHRISPTALVQVAKTLTGDAACDSCTTGKPFKLLTVERNGKDQGCQSKGVDAHNTLDGAPADTSWRPPSALYSGMDCVFATMTRKMVAVHPSASSSPAGHTAIVEDYCGGF